MGPYQVRKTSSQCAAERYRKANSLRSWRIATTHDGLAAIGARVGYASEAAFSRAFKKLVGVPPATWRRRRPGQSMSRRDSGCGSPECHPVGNR